MSDEYNSRLLYLLENHSSQRELIDALEEMSESGSEVFLYPVYGTYKKFKSTPISHYFLSVLGSINSPRALSLLKEVFNASDTKRGDKLWILPYFEKNGLFEDNAISFTIEQLTKLQTTGIMEDEDSDEYELPGILLFLKSAQKLNKIEDLIESILFDSSQRRQIRKIIFFYWVREKPDIRFQYLIDNYDLNKDDELDIIIADEIKKWKGNLVNQLIDLIKSKGYARAKEILEKFQEKEQIVSVQRKEVQYPNIELVKEIISLRNKVNFLAQEHKKLGFKIFENSEILVAQQDAISSREVLDSRCIELRDIIQNITNEAKSHNTELAEAKKIILDITKESLNKSLNALHINLVTRGLTIPSDFFNFRNLNQAVSLIAAHPNETKTLISSLNKNGLLDDYKKENWQELHTKLLYLYKNSLEMFVKTLS